MTEVESFYKNWRSLLSTNTADNEEFQWSTSQINEKLGAVQLDVQDLEDTVAIVEQHPTKFSLAPNELAERKRFIVSVRQRMQEITADMTSPTTRGKMEKDKREVRPVPRRPRVGGPERKGLTARANDADAAPTGAADGAHRPLCGPRRGQRPSTPVTAHATRRCAITRPLLTRTVPSWCAHQQCSGAAPRGDVRGGLAGECLTWLDRPRDRAGRFAEVLAHRAPGRACGSGRRVRVATQVAGRRHWQRAG